MNVTKILNLVQPNYKSLDLPTVDLTEIHVTRQIHLGIYLQNGTDSLRDW